MVAVTLTEEALTVHLRPSEKVMALHGDVVVPRAAITSLTEVRGARSHLRGWRLGTSIPGSLALGTWRGVGFKDFVAVRGNGSALLVHCHGHSFDRLLVSGSVTGEGVGGGVTPAREGPSRGATSWARELAVAVLLTVLADSAISLLLGAGHLPDPIALHWAGGGAPNGSGGRTAVVWLWALSVLVPVVCAGAGTLVRPAGRPLPSLAVLVGLPVAVVGAVAVTVVEWSNYGTTSWHAARHLPGWTTGAAALAVVGAGVLAVAVIRAE